MSDNTNSGKTTGRMLMLAGLGLELLAIGLLIRGIVARQSNIPVAMMLLVAGLGMLSVGRNMMKSQ